MINFGDIEAAESSINWLGKSLAENWKHLTVKCNGSWNSSSLSYVPDLVVFFRGGKGNGGGGTNPLDRCRITTLPGYWAKIDVF